jgi:glyoxylase-like metal-dependent hydrolase (beta-lactamase superfamily II)
MSEVVWPPGMQVFERGWVSSNNIFFADVDADADADTGAGAKGATLVDTGYGAHAAQTQALVAHALTSSSLSSLTRIINTHTHSDHIGGNAALARAYPSVEIHVPVGEADVLRTWDDAALHLSVMGQECEPFSFHQTFDRDDLFRLGGTEWRVLASPGHDMESLMLYCEEYRLLISADALWEHGFGVIFPALELSNTVKTIGGTGSSAHASFHAQRATLDLIASLDIAQVIPGHGAPFTDVNSALARANARIDGFIADPSRNDRNALKVTLAFLLMLEGRLPLASLPERLAGLPMAQILNARLFAYEPGALANFLCQELIKARAAKIDGEYLVVA